MTHINYLMLFLLILACSNSDDSNLFITKIEKKNSLKVLILGNSITGAPSFENSWDQGWGIAASSPEKDFVHLLFDKLKSNLGFSPDFKTVSLTNF